MKLQGRFKKRHFTGVAIALVAVFLWVDPFEIRGDSVSPDPQRSAEYQKFIEQYPKNTTPEQEEVFRKAREREKMPEK